MNNINKMVNKIRILLIVMGAALLTACSPKNLVYFSDLDRMVQNVEGMQVLPCTIQKDDLLSILVSSETPESAIPFNLETSRMATLSNATVNPGVSDLKGYLVDASGRINFPVLGLLKVQSMTTTQLARELEYQLKSSGYINDPKVTVRILNFKVSVLGEVARPGEINVGGERITLFEALSQAGDLTIYGRRDNVAIIREDGYKRKLVRVDLTNDSLFESPYYYLCQNDVIYVEPNQTKKRASRNTEAVVISTVSGVLSLISTVAMIYYYYLLSKK